MIYATKMINSGIGNNCNQMEAWYLFSSGEPKATYAEQKEDQCDLDIL